jgi:hypothetical protein
VRGLARFSLYLAVALIAAQTVTLAQQTDLKGTLRRGPDGKLYLDTSQPPPPAPSAEAAPADNPAPPPAAVPAGVAGPAAPAPAARGGPRSLAVCPHGCSYASLAQALSAAGPGDTVSIGAGIYAEAGVIAADRVRLIAAPGVEIKGVAVEGKAAIVVKGSDVLIEGIDCSQISVPDHNGACVRLEGHNLTLRHVHFHDAEEGVLTGPQTGTLTIEDSVLERLGAGGLAHAVYAGEMEALVIRRSAILSSKGEGHEVKSRAAATTIENSVIASLDGLDSRTLDIPNGGVLTVRDSVLEKGLNSTTSEVIGFGLEGVKYPVNAVRLDKVKVIIDRKGGVLMNGHTDDNYTDVSVTGGERAVDSRLRWVADRAAAGLPAYPQLPSVAGAPKAETGERAALRVCPSGCSSNTLTDALRTAPSGSTITIGPGYYHEGGALRANHVTLKAEPGVHLEGGAVEGKAALVIKGDDTVIEGLDCSRIEVPDQNGACIRLEGRNLTLRKVYFHDSQEGLLANDGTGTILIEDSRFEKLGAAGRSHAIYVGKADSLTIRGTSITATQGKGHGVKSRAAHLVIETSVIATLDGQDSRLIDVANGGDLLIRRSVLEKGPASDNVEAIGFGLEGMSYAENSLKIEDCQIILDRPDATLARSVLHGSVTGGRIVGGSVGGGKELVGRLTDLVAPGRVGDNLTFAADVAVFGDRAAAGLKPFPALPGR